jgi:pyrimidine-nucleoside phosphorylase
MIGQTKEIAPADKKLYALRDVTGTVESIPLIAGSIMSKKLAEGIDALVLDIKTGRGAFMQYEAEAVELAKTLITIGNKFGKKTIGLLTDMSQPLGYGVGNWLEVVECIECMQGKEVDDLMAVTYALGGAMLMLGGKANSIEEGATLCRDTIQSGKALRKFIELVRRQGGDVSFINNLRKYPTSKYSIEIKSSLTGYVDNIDALEVGFVCIMIGAGRMKVDDAIDPKAGIILRKKVGDSIDAGETLATLYTDNEKIVDQAKHRIERAFLIATEPPPSPPLILAIIDDRGVHPWRDV